MTCPLKHRSQPGIPRDLRQFYMYYLWEASHVANYLKLWALFAVPYSPSERTGRSPSSVVCCFSALYIYIYIYTKHIPLIRPLIRHIIGVPLTILQCLSLQQTYTKCMMVCIRFVSVAFHCEEEEIFEEKNPLSWPIVALPWVRPWMDMAETP